jgi:hypothetical protein
MALARGVRDAVAVGTGVSMIGVGVLVGGATAGSSVLTGVSIWGEVWAANWPLLSGRKNR